MKEKMKLGPRTKPVLATLARSKRVRGTLADPFRWAEVRKLERAMIPEYERAVARAGRRASTAANLDEAVEIASLPDQVRGYEHLKLARAANYRERSHRPVGDVREPHRDPSPNGSQRARDRDAPSE